MAYAPAMTDPRTRFLVDTSGIPLVHALQDYVYFFNTVRKGLYVHTVSICSSGCEVGAAKRN